MVNRKARAVSAAGSNLSFNVCAGDDSHVKISFKQHCADFDPNI